MTVRELLESSLRLIGVLAVGENMDADQGETGLQSLNQLLGSWSNEGLMIFSEVRESFPFVAGQGAYTVGVGANFNTTKPQFIDRVSLLDTQSGQNIEYPVNIVTLDQYSLLSNRSFQSDYPSCVWITNQAETMTLNFYPIPQATKSCVIYSKKKLSSYSGLSDTVTLPEGYTRALRYDLAVELGIEYGAAPSELVLRERATIKRDIRRLNAQELKSISDVYNLVNKNYFNIWTREV